MMKRSNTETDNGDAEVSQSKKKIKLSHQKKIFDYFCAKPASNGKKKVCFNTVTVYYFQREQGYQCIPNTGTSTIGELFVIVSNIEGCQYNLIKIHNYLGMSYTHYHEEKYAIDEFRKHKRQMHLEIIEKNFYIKKDLVASLNKLNDDILMSDHEDAGEKAVSSFDLKKSRQLLDVDFDLPMNMELFCPILTPTERTRIIKKKSKVDDTEGIEIKKIRKSREQCGCKCKDSCETDACECNINGIGCQLDKSKYPCSCSFKHCKNPFGLKRFDNRLVRQHYDVHLSTICTMNSQLNDDKITVTNSCMEMMPYAPFDIFQYISSDSILCSAS
jgi:cysteine/serine-rich nuclear protein